MALCRGFFTAPGTFFGLCADGLSPCGTLKGSEMQNIDRFVIPHGQSHLHRSAACLTTDMETALVLGVSTRFL